MNTLKVVRPVNARAARFGLLMDCNDVSDAPATPAARKDQDSKGRFGPVRSTAAIHNRTTITAELHGGYAASPGLDFSSKETSANHYIAPEED